jgi:hypothetical protein
VIERTCAFCGSPIPRGRRADSKFCSDVHKQAHYRRRKDPEVGSARRKARQREAASLRRWLRFQLPREIRAALSYPPRLAAGQRALEREIAQTFGIYREQAGFDSWLTSGWIERQVGRPCRNLCGQTALPSSWMAGDYCAACLARRYPPSPPQFTLGHSAQFGCESKPASYWSTPVTCGCGSSDWVRGGSCWTCRQERERLAVTQPREGKAVLLFGVDSQPTKQKGEDECAA